METMVAWLFMALLGAGDVARVAHVPGPSADPAGGGDGMRGGTPQMTWPMAPQRMQRDAPKNVGSCEASVGQ